MGLLEWPGANLLKEITYYLIMLKTYYYFICFPMDYAENIERGAITPLTFQLPELKNMRSLGQSTSEVSCNCPQPMYLRKC